MSFALIVNDRTVSALDIKALRDALESAFNGTMKWSVEQRSKVNLSREGMSEITKSILGAQPSVLILDMQLGRGTEDGALLLDRLRKDGFSGFAYIWTAADPTSHKKRYASLLDHRGGGAYNSLDVVNSPKRIAEDILKSWTALHGFAIDKPGEKRIRELLDPSLRVLSKLQEGLWALQAGGDGAVNAWKTCVERAYAIYADEPDGFCGSLVAHHSDAVVLNQVGRSMEQMKKLPVTNTAAIQEELVVLRDAMLAAAESGELSGGMD
jgi:hypothetical protein